MTADEKRQEKARQMRYKKPLVRDLNLDAISEELWNIMELCEDIRWAYDDDEALADALGGEEDELEEFKMMFSDLEADCEQMRSDLDEQWVPDCFDRFFVAVGAGDDYGGLMGYDSYERDYVGLDVYMDSVTEKEARENLKKSMTKDQLLDAATQCFRVYQNYVGLKYRYDCLEATIDILKEKNLGVLQAMRHIQELYDKAEADSKGFEYNWYNSVEEMDKAIREMPREVWLW